MADNNRAKEQRQQRTERVEQVTGVVIDVAFPDQLPEIYHALEIDVPPEEGRTEGRPWSARSSSTSATTACARSRWTRPTACSAATR